MERVHNEIDQNEEEPDDLEISDYIDASCDLCAEKTFTTFNAVLSHYTDVHNNSGYVKCCQKKFNRLPLFKDHIEWHRNPNIFTYVHKISKLFISFKIQSSHSDKNFLFYFFKFNSNRCKACKKIMTSRLTLRQHEVLHTKKHFCDECQRSFRNSKYLKRHLDSHKGTKTKYICNICNKT